MTQLHSFPREPCCVELSEGWTCLCEVEEAVNSPWISTACCMPSHICLEGLYNYSASQTATIFMRTAVPTCKRSSQLGLLTFHRRRSIGEGHGTRHWISRQSSQPVVCSSALIARGLGVWKWTSLCCWGCTRDGDSSITILGILSLFCAGLPVWLLSNHLCFCLYSLTSLLCK